MKTLDLLNREQPKLKIITESGEIVLTRRRVLAKDAAAHAEKIAELEKQRIAGDLTDLDYTFGVLELMVDGMDRAAFDNVDIYALREITEAVADLGRETSDQKKTE